MSLKTAGILFFGFTVSIVIASMILGSFYLAMMAGLDKATILGFLVASLVTALQLRYVFRNEGDDDDPDDDGDDDPEDPDDPLPVGARSHQCRYRDLRVNT